MRSSVRARLAPPFFNNLAPPILRLRSKTFQFNLPSQPALQPVHPPFPSSEPPHAAEIQERTAHRFPLWLKCASVASALERLSGWLRLPPSRFRKRFAAIAKSLSSGRSLTSLRQAAGVVGECSGRSLRFRCVPIGKRDHSVRQNGSP